MNVQPAGTMLRRGARNDFLRGLLVAGLLVSAHGSLADCTVTASGVPFGSYDPFSATDLDGTGSIDVSCSPSASYTISLAPGNGSYTQREMTSGANVMNFNLYTDATRTVVWGDGTGATGTVSGTGTSGTHTVYGRVPAEQNLPVGSYSDSMTVTVSF